MGTQLAYGGSGSAPWEEAADDAVLIDGSADGAAGGDDAGDPAPGTDSNLDSLIDHVIEAIQAHESRPIPGAPMSYTPTSVRPSPYTGGGSSVSSSTSKFVSTPRSGRSAKLSVGRGAAAVAAGSALARGDAAGLQELGRVSQASAWSREMLTACRDSMH